MWLLKNKSPLAIGHVYGKMVISPTEPQIPNTGLFFNIRMKDVNPDSRITAQPGRCLHPTPGNPTINLDPPDPVPNPNRTPAQG